MRKTFYNFIIFLFYTLDSIFFAVFDIFFYLESTLSFSNNIKKELFGVICIESLF